VSERSVSARALEFHPWDAMAPAACARLVPVYEDGILCRAGGGYRAHGFFRKVGEGAAGPDDWQRQGLNARSVLRYSWRDRLRAIIRRG
jgi:hypothetical protein